MFARYEVAETPEGFVYGFGYSTMSGGSGSPMCKRNLKGSRAEATSAAIDGLGHRLVLGFEHEQRHGSAAQVARYKKLLDWLFGQEGLIA